MIIIETPAPPKRERLVVVPPDSCTPVFDDGKPAGLSIRAQGARDATPEDLARGGYVPAFSDLEASRDHYRDAHLHAIARAERAERERDEARCTEHFVRGKLVSAVAERDEARRRAKADMATLQEAIVRTENRAERAERERDEARAELARLTAPAEGEPTPGQLLDACPPAGGIERLLACYRLGVAHERARQQPAQDRESLGRLVREVWIEWAREQPSPKASWLVPWERLPEPDREVDRRIGERLARQQPAQDRATDEELERAFYAAYDPVVTNGQGAIEGRSAGVLAVAARVRAERCLVAQAVGMGADMRIEENRTRPGWYVRVTVGETTANRCDTPPADVPATLARLLGEVGR